MLRSLRSGMGRRVMAVTLATTFAALLVTAAALIVYDLRTYQSAWVSDLVTQADILGRASGPALSFDDASAAQANLALLQVRPQIYAAAIYNARGALVASYMRPDLGVVALPPGPGPDGHRIEGNQLGLFHAIVENRELVGTIYLRARYELLDRLINYLGIVGLAMAASLIVAFLVSARLQRGIVRPILGITDVAHGVMEQQDFSLRVQKTTDDEIGYLVDTFNAMLAEVGRRSDALEASNRNLQHEMAVRRTAEDALRAADKRKDEFLATLAHELRNPLAPLRTGLHLLRVAGDDAARAEPARAMMERQLQQMIRLVDDLLDVSRITTGRLALRKERVDLRAVVDNAVDTARPFIDQRKHQLTLHVPDAPVMLDADPTRLAQVFSNLLNNAAKFTEPGGRLSLDARVLDGLVEVRVSDNGIGIAPEMLGEIFEMFHQLDGSLERASSGLGVGLTLARRLVELHDGIIEASSEGPGKGAQFTVRLPLAQSDAPAMDRPPSTTADLAPARHRILLADDNTDFVTSLALLLRMIGHEVEVTYDGAAALKVAPGYRPDVAILDIGLPHLNGYEVARKLRAMPETRNTVLIAVTGWGQEADRRRSQEAGFDHHLVKPVEPDQIEALLRELRPPQPAGPARKQAG